MLSQASIYLYAERRLYLIVYVPALLNGRGHVLHHTSHSDDGHVKRFTTSVPIILS